MPSEKVTQGTHYEQLHSNLSKEKTQAVLSVLDRSPALGFLRVLPIKAIELLRATERGWSGSYDHVAQQIQVNTIRRLGENYGQTFVPGNSFSMSMATRDKVESMRRSLLQEIAHHLQKTVAPIASTAFENPARRPITRYAARLWEEYFAESWVAYHVENAALKSYDPVGYKMVEDVLLALKRQAE